jgi:cysteine desulfurase/selenocysteine lyase
MLEKDFTILQNRKISYLDNAATTQKPKIVIDSIKDFYEKYNSNVHRGLYTLSEEATLKLEDARKIVAKFINADYNEIVFVKNTTEGLNNLANSIERTLVITKEHNIVSTVIEHHSNFVPWQQLAKRTGAEFRVIDYDTKAQKLLDLSKSVDENTLIVAFTGMSNVTGLKIDIKKIVKEIRKKNNNAIIIVDATQLIAHDIVDVKNLDVDFLVFSAHKVYGPTGVGVVYGKKLLLEKIHPFHYGGNMVNKVELQDTTWADIPEKFEAGTIDTPGIVAFSKALEYLNKNNYKKLLQYEESLKNYALTELRKIKQVKIIGHNNREVSYGPVISFTLDKVHPHDLSSICDEHNVCIRAGHHCAQPLMKKLGLLATSRLSISFYNTKADIDKLVESIKNAIKIIGN